ncbi:MAG: hypothetical protein AB7D46_04345 [Flavobacteriaceae bacterium]
MKKGIIVIFLFVFPIVAYLFFASGVNSFTKLPTITEKVDELPDWESLDGKNIKLQDKITVLGFMGTQVLENKSNAFNLNQLIYNKNKSFLDFQIVMIVPIEAKTDIEQLIYEFEWAKLTSFSGWKFVFATKDEIKNYYNKLGLINTLDENAGTPFVYILDKERNLRGRKGMNKKGKEEYKEGYSTISPAELKNEMEDDFKIILYEYRAAFKKNQPKREI